MTNQEKDVGSWKFISDNTVVCPNCGQEFSGHDDYKGCEWNYCPNCGKKKNKNTNFEFRKDGW